jgi:hypothetical protein
MKPSEHARLNAARAYDAMRAARPYALANGARPGDGPRPPRIRHVDTRTTGARELAREIRRGSYEP